METFIRTLNMYRIQKINFQCSKLVVIIYVSV